MVAKLVGLRKSPDGEMREAFSYYQAVPKVEELIGLLKWLVFSDTIMLYTEFEDADSHGQ